jgi:hypothetical protein
VRGPSSNWFGKDSRIEGQIETNRGHEIGVQVIVTSDVDSTRSDSTDRDGRYVVRDLKPGKHVVHFLVPDHEQHVDVDLQPFQTLRVDLVVDEDSLGHCCIAGHHNPSHHAHVLQKAPTPCGAIPSFVGMWLEIPSADTHHRVAQHVKISFFEDGSFRVGFQLEGLVPGKSFGTWCAADASAALVTLKLHDQLLVDFAYKMEGEVLRYETEDTGTLRLKRVGQ